MYFNYILFTPNIMIYEIIQIIKLPLIKWLNWLRVIKNFFFAPLLTTSTTKWNLWNNQTHNLSIYLIYFFTYKNEQ